MGVSRALGVVGKGGEGSCKRLNYQRFAEVFQHLSDKNILLMKCGEQNLCTLICLVSLDNCRTPDQTKIKIKSNQKSGKALYLGGCGRRGRRGSFAELGTRTNMSETEVE